MAVKSQWNCTIYTGGIAPNQRRHRRYLPRSNNFPVSNFPGGVPIPGRVTLKTFAHNPGRNTSSNSEQMFWKPWVPRLPPFPSSGFPKNLLTAMAFGAGANLLYMLLEGGGGGRNNAGKILRGGGGGGEAGQTSNFWSRLFSLQGLDEEDNKLGNNESEFYRVGSPVYMLGSLKKYNVSDVLFFDRKLDAFTDPIEDPLFKLVSLVPGQVYTRSQLQKELDNLKASGFFEEVDMDCRRNRDGSLRLRISFLERTWQQPAGSFRCINVGMIPNWNPEIDVSGANRENVKKKDMLRFVKEGIHAEYSKRIAKSNEKPCLLPMALQEEISEIFKRREKAGEMSSRVLVNVKGKVEQWYDDHGYACAQVISFGKLNTQELICEVAEGDITRVQVEDASGSGSVIESVLPYELRKGEAFNIEAAEKAKSNIEALGLFSEIDLGLDEENGGGVIVKLKVDKKRQDDSGVDVSNEDSFHQEYSS